MNFFSTYIVLSLLVVAFAIFAASVRIVHSDERAMVFTLGRLKGVKGPGIVVLVPFFQKMVRVDFKYGARTLESRRNSLNYTRHSAVAQRPNVDRDRRQTAFEHQHHGDWHSQVDYAQSG